MATSLGRSTEGLARTPAHAQSATPSPLSPEAKPGPLRTRSASPAPRLGSPATWPPAGWGRRGGSSERLPRARMKVVVGERLSPPPTSQASAGASRTRSSGPGAQQRGPTPPGTCHLHAARLGDAIRRRPEAPRTPPLPGRLGSAVPFRPRPRPSRHSPLPPQERGSPAPVRSGTRAVTAPPGAPRAPAVPGRCLRSRVCAENPCVPSRSDFPHRSLNSRAPAPPTGDKGEQYSCSQGRRPATG